MSPKETVRLQQFMKLMGLVTTGGEAKILIQEGQVKVNGQVETRRKRQLAAGDRVTVGGQTFVVELGADPGMPAGQADAADT